MNLDVNIRDISFFSNKKISNYKVLSKSLGMLCIKIETKNKGSFVIKKNIKKNSNYDALKYESKSLIYMKNLFPNIFSKVFKNNNDILIMEYISHDNFKGKNFEKDLAEKISSIHNINNEKYGFDFDTPIGALRQPSNYSDNWINFFGENRLGMIFNHINKSNPMPNKLNLKIEKILKNLKDLIPYKPAPALIHGDLWEGNILFDQGKIKGLIDPGIYFAHNEMEISYLTWFRYVTNNFLNYYSEINKIDKYYYKYEPIYQLYYCLLNVHLWDRKYITNANELVNKIY